MHPNDTASRCLVQNGKYSDPGAARQKARRRFAQQRLEIAVHVRLVGVADVVGEISPATVAGLAGADGGVGPPDSLESLGTESDAAALENTGS